MKVLKKWKANPDKLKQEGEPTSWFETTVKECIEHTEESGYWKRGTVKKLLENGHIVFTPFAEYKIDKD
jgi:hypothetical protein